MRENVFEKVPEKLLEKVFENVPEKISRVKSNLGQSSTRPTLPGRRVHAQYTPDGHVHARECDTFSSEMGSMFLLSKILDKRLHSHYEASSTRVRTFDAS